MSVNRIGRPLWRPGTPKTRAGKQTTASRQGGRNLMNKFGRGRTIQPEVFFQSKHFLNTFFYTMFVYPIGLFTNLFIPFFTTRVCIRLHTSSEHGCEPLFVLKKGNCRNCYELFHIDSASFNSPQFTLASCPALICRSHASLQARRFKHLYGSYGKALLAEESASNEHFTMV